LLYIERSAQGLAAGEPALKGTTAGTLSRGLDEFRLIVRMQSKDSGKAPAHSVTFRSEMKQGGQN